MMVSGDLWAGQTGSVGHGGCSSWDKKLPPRLLQVPGQVLSQRAREDVGRRAARHPAAKPVAVGSLSGRVSDLAGLAPLHSGRRRPAGPQVRSP